jgi:hypothetical protein
VCQSLQFTIHINFQDGGLLMSDYFSLKLFFHLSTCFTSFLCGFWIYPTLNFLGNWLGVFFVQPLWKCDIWIAKFFKFYTVKIPVNTDSHNVNNVVCVWQFDYKILYAQSRIYTSICLYHMQSHIVIRASVMYSQWRATSVMGPKLINPLLIDLRLLPSNNTWVI